ncbi:MAG: hypothetical protein QM564_02770 [Bergeyella sp.]
MNKNTAETRTKALLYLFSRWNGALLFMVFCFSAANAQVYIGNNAVMTVSGDAVVYEVDSTRTETLKTTETVKLYAAKGAVLSGFENTNAEIAYIDSAELRSAEKPKPAEKLFKEKIVKTEETALAVQHNSNAGNTLHYETLPERNSLSQAFGGNTVSAAAASFFQLKHPAGADAENCICSFQFFSLYHSEDYHKNADAFLHSVFPESYSVRPPPIA